MRPAERVNSRLVAALAASMLFWLPALAPVSADDTQSILAPGLYLYQTRTRDGTCNDAPRTGYVTSSLATLDGVPGSRTMTMKLPNSPWWPNWQLTITQADSIVGTANMKGAKDKSRGDTYCELRAKKDRYQGTGTRSYLSTIDGKKVKCKLRFDALLKPLG